MAYVLFRRKKKYKKTPTKNNPGNIFCCFSIRRWVFYFHKTLVYPIFLNSTIIHTHDDEDDDFENRSTNYYTITIGWRLPVFVSSMTCPYILFGNPNVLITYAYRVLQCKLSNIVRIPPVVRCNNILRLFVIIITLLWCFLNETDTQHYSFGWRKSVANVCVLFIRGGGGWGVIIVK